MSDRWYLVPAARAVRGTDERSGDEQSEYSPADPSLRRAEARAQEMDGLMVVAPRRKQRE